MSFLFFFFYFFLFLSFFLFFSVEDLRCSLFSLIRIFNLLSQNANLILVVYRIDSFQSFTSSLVGLNLHLHESHCGSLPLSYSFSHSLIFFKNIDKELCRQPER